MPVDKVDGMPMSRNPGASRPSLRPAALRPGDTVAVVNTSSPATAAQFEQLTRYLTGRGCRVQISPGARAETGYLAGSAEQRAADLMAAFGDPQVRLVLPIAGGRGAADLLPFLDFDVISANPKVFTALSNPTILANAIYRRSGLLTLHHATGLDFYQPEVNHDTETAFWRIVSGPVTGRALADATWRVIRGAGQRIVGPVFGGHLSTNRALVGTAWLPDLTGAVLILEEVGAPWALVHATLTHLRLAGVFDTIGALIVGVPVECERDDAPDEDWEALILRHVGGSFPILTNVEFGHTMRRIPFVIGGQIEVDLTRDVAVLRYRDDLVTTP
jgi:muramoyltetrapeptide carboxypeptidase